MSLDSEKTAALLKEVNKAYNTRIDDILLTALSLALGRWSPMSRMAITLEGHGREEIMDDINISRTVGWFTTMYPVILDTTHRQLSQAIIETKENLRRIPDKGIGYGILRYLTPLEKKKNSDFVLEPEIGFNYLGQFDGQNQGSDPNFAVSPLDKGHDISPNSHSKFVLAINGMVIGGCLGFQFSFNRCEFFQGQMQQLADHFRSSLEAIIDFCIHKEDTEMTISDYDAADLDQEEMDAIYEELELE